jgi:hypothetical protein
MLTPEEAVRKYAAAWLEQDEAERRHLLEQAWADDAELVTPEASITGCEALVQHIGRFIQESKDVTPLISGIVEEHHGLLRFDWQLIHPDLITVVDQVCFGELAGDGRLRRIVVFHGLRPGEGRPDSGDEPVAKKRYTMQIHELTTDDIRRKLADYEEKYGMGTQEFYKKYNRGELEEDLDYMRWASYYDMAAAVGIVNLRTGRIES